MPLNKISIGNLELNKYFTKTSLIPAIIQEAKTGDVLMLAYMNKESLINTLETGYTWFYSRSRKELWNKGATSGHFQKVISINADCDEDALLIQVEQTGAACHTGKHSCFFNQIEFRYEGQIDLNNQWKLNAALNGLYETIEKRKANYQEGSYTCYLFEKGIDKILKKCGEECSEVIIAAKNHDINELTNEICDLIYHISVLMVELDLPLENIYFELKKRRLKIGNLKQFHQVEKNS